MHFLINASNLKVGGALQVTDSICRSLERYPNHRFYVVLSRALNATADKIKAYANVEVFQHDIRNDWRTVLMGRDRFLDSLVLEYQIDAVLTVFGPSRWDPRCPHLCGFAMPHLVLQDSPYFQRMGALQRAKQRMRSNVLTYFFRRSTRYFYTENPYISSKWEKRIKGAKVFTVTNYYNQVFDTPEEWQAKELPSFDGITLLTITANYPHKNLSILPQAARVLKEQHPDFQFRFVVTQSVDQLSVDDRVKQHFLLIGKVDIRECPSLYEQCDMMVLPSLLECFSASYPEAMRMGRPIVTTDIEFAKGLCGEAACYYSPLSAESLAEAIYKVATDHSFSQHLILAGRERLGHFDSYEMRANKLIGILDTLAHNKR